MRSKYSNLNHFHVIVVMQGQAALDSWSILTFMNQTKERPITNHTFRNLYLQGRGERKNEEINMHRTRTIRVLREGGNYLSSSEVTATDACNLPADIGSLEHNSRTYKARRRTLPMSRIYSNSLPAHGEFRQFRSREPSRRIYPPQTFPLGFSQA